MISFTIDSIPTGCKVYIDASPGGAFNGSYGNTPWTFTQLTPGDYTFSVRGPYPLEPAFYSITLNDGDVLEVTLDLNTGLPIEPGDGILSVTSNPEGASVYADGTLLGVTPLTISLSVGNYEIELQLTGYDTYVTTASVLAGETTEVSATLSPETPPAEGTFGNNQQYPGLNNISNYARTNWFDVLEPCTPVSIGAWIKVEQGPCLVRAGIYEYISKQTAGALLAQSEEIYLPSGFDGLQRLTIVGTPIQLPAGRCHVMINSYGDGAASIYRGGWTDGSEIGLVCWWGMMQWPDPFGTSGTYTETISEQGALMSLFVEYIPSGAPPVVQPRTDTIYWTQAELDELKTSPTHQPLYDNIVAWAEQHIDDPFPTLPSMVWRYWMDLATEVREYIETMGFLYWMTNDSRYFTAGKRWLMAIPTIPPNSYYPNHWQVTATFGLAMAAGYDEFHELLTPAELQTVRFDIITKMGAMKSAEGYYPDRYPNHMAVLCFVGICGLALGDDYLGSQEWIDYGIQQVNGVFARQVDGCYEGPGYACYGMDVLIPFVDALRRKTGHDLVTPYSLALAELPYYIIHMNYNGQMISMEDSTPYQTWLKSGETFLSWMYWLAKEFNDGYVQYFSDVMASQGVWQSYVWRAKELQPIPVSSLPTRRYFPGIGYLFYRSGWGPLAGPDDNLVIIFKCGHSAWHAHPDQNSFTIYMNQKMISGGPGYTTGYGQWDQTRCHNCIIGDGHGQAQEIGDLGHLPWGVSGIVEEVKLAEHYTYIRGDASPPFDGYDGIRQQLWTSLALSLGIDDPTLTVPSGEADRLRFPEAHWTTPSFYLQVDDEYIYCSGRTGDVCTIAARGQYGTAIVPHAVGAPVGLYYYDLHAGDLSKCIRHMVMMSNPSYFIVMDEVKTPKVEKLEYCLQGNGGSFAFTGELLTLNNNINLNVMIVEPHPFTSELISNRTLTKYPSMRISPELDVAKTNFLTVLFPGFAALLTTAINQGNLLGVEVQIDEDHIDLHLFSANGQPVSEWIDLEDYYQPVDGQYYSFSDTMILAQFSNYMVARLVRSTAPPRNLHVTSVPTGATVFLDEVNAGTTPLSLDIEPGTYQLRVSLSGYFDWPGSITIVDGQVTEVNAILEKKPTSIVPTVAVIASVVVLPAIIAAIRR